MEHTTPLKHQLAAIAYSNLSNDAKEVLMERVNNALNERIMRYNTLEENTNEQTNP